MDQMHLQSMVGGGIGSLHRTVVAFQALHIVRGERGQVPGRIRTEEG